MTIQTAGEEIIRSNGDDVLQQSSKYPDRRLSTSCLAVPDRCDRDKPVLPHPANWFDPVVDQSESFALPKGSSFPVCAKFDDGRVILFRAGIAFPGLLPM